MRRVPFAGLAGGLTLLLAALVASPVTAQERLTQGSSRSGSLETGDTISYAIEAGDDFILYGEVDQQTVDVVVSLHDDEGRRVGGPWDGPARGAEAFSTTIDEAGSYTLRIAPFEDEEGDFTISLMMLEARSDNPARLADQLMFAYNRDGGPGGAVRVWQDGRTVFSRAYGLADLTHGIEFREDTPTNIGSTSKQFTAFAIMLEQERGNLSLDDDIRDYFPEFPDHGETVTIENLLTHTSGLREFLNLWAITGADTRGLDRDDVLTAARRQPGLQNVPGDEWNYNNTAFSLAAQIVEQTSGQDFDDYMREHVFQPLGMNDSYVRMTNSTIIPGRSNGYTAGAGGWTEPGDLGGAVGAGGIYASVEDLQKWAENMLSPRVGTQETMEAMRTEFVLNDGEGSGYGYGLFVDEQRGLVRIHHGGADVSHRSMLMMFPEIDAGLTVQSNAASFNSSGTAADLAEAFFGPSMEPEAEAPADDADFDPETWDVANFEAFAGTYSMDPAPQIQARFYLEGDSMKTVLTGQESVDLRVTGPNTFEIVQVPARIVFDEPGEDGVIPGFTLFQGGQEIHGTRIAEAEVEEAPEEWEPTTEELEEFVGRYFSEEVETFYTIHLEMPDEDAEEDAEPRLHLTQLRMGEVPMTAMEKDAFRMGNGATLEFERDRAGNVIAVYVDATRSRDIRFEKVR